VAVEVDPPFYSAASSSPRLEVEEAEEEVFPQLALQTILEVEEAEALLALQVPTPILARKLQAD